MLPTYTSTIGIFARKYHAKWSLNILFIQTTHVFILRGTTGFFPFFFLGSRDLAFRHGARRKELVSRALIFLVGVTQCFRGWGVGFSHSPTRRA